MNLNFPAYQFRLRQHDLVKEIFDEVRKRWVTLTPEEWVRQNVVRWLQEEKKYVASLMALEKQIKVNGLLRRCDVVCHNANAEPLLIVECKAPDVRITQDVFDQAARYNRVIAAKYFLLTNGRQHFCCEMDTENQQWKFLKELPIYE